MVYFIHDDVATAIKIGYSTNVKQRLADLQTSSSTKLVLLGVMPGSMNDERRLHAKFERLHGEWFRVTPELLEFIREHTTPQIPAPLPMPKPQPKPAPRSVYRPAAPPQPQRTEPMLQPVYRPTFFARIHDLAAFELRGMLIYGAYISLDWVILPMRLGIRLEGANWWALLTIYLLVCIWGFTHKYRDEVVQIDPVRKAARSEVVANPRRKLFARA
jgi:hypothetical protein